jgi:hypothetical protein
MRTTLEIPTAETIAEMAREIYGDFLGLAHYAAMAERGIGEALRNAGDAVEIADWAVNMVTEYAAQDGIELIEFCKITVH